MKEKLKAFFAEMKAARAMRQEKRQKAAAEKEKAKADATEKYERTIAENPYLQSRALWNELYGDVQTRLQNSYRVILILSVSLCVAIVGIVWIANQSRVKPLPVLIHDKYALTMTSMPSLSQKNLDALVPFFTKDFLRAIRSVSVDGTENSQNKVRAYSYTKGEASGILKAFYEKNDPDVIARNSEKTIQVSSILQKTEHTVTARWIEQWRDEKTGSLIKERRFIADLTFEFGTPSTNDTIVENNPLGFYITHLSWSLDQNV